MQHFVILSKSLFLFCCILSTGNSYTKEFLNGNYRLNWVIDRNNTITFTASAVTSGWVGFGINSYMTLTGAHLTVAGVSGTVIIPTQPPPTGTGSPSTSTFSTGDPTNTNTMSTTADTETTYPPDTTPTSVLPTESTSGDTSSTSVPPNTLSTVIPTTPTVTPPPPSAQSTTIIAPTTTAPTTTTISSTTAGWTIPITFPTRSTTTDRLITYPITNIPRQNENESYNHTFIGTNEYDLGNEYFGTSWSFLGATQFIQNGTLPVTSVQWQRDLRGYDPSETDITPYEDIYIILLYSDYDAIDGSNIKERLIQKINFFHPSSSMSLNFNNNLLLLLIFSIVLYF